jgi:hypothetical protein
MTNSSNKSVLSVTRYCVQLINSNAYELGVIKASTLVLQKLLIQDLLRSLEHVDCKVVYIIQQVSKLGNRPFAWSGIVLNNFRHQN